MRMYIYIWKFSIGDDKKNEFEMLYGENGPWVELFKTDSNYIKTELLRDLKNSDQYLTIDYWATKDAYQLFHANNLTKYNEIDARCEMIVRHEVLVGEYELSLFNFN